MQSVSCYLNKQLCDWNTLTTDESAGTKIEKKLIAFGTDEVNNKPKPIPQLAPGLSTRNSNQE